MTSSRAPEDLASFGEFEVRLDSGEIYRNRSRVRVPDQSFQVLKILLGRPGKLVTREDLRRQLWAEDTFVDFDHGLNNSVNRLREALGDSASAPRYIETLPRRGYRFIAPVSWSRTDEDDSSAPSVPDPLAAKADSQEASTAPRSRSVFTWFAAAASLLLLAGLSVPLHRTLSGKHLHIRSLAVLPLVNLTGDPAQEYLADGLTDALIASLAEEKSLRVISRTSAMHYKASREPVTKIATELAVDAVVEGSVSRTGDRVVLRVELIDPHADGHLWAATYDRDARDLKSLETEAARGVASAAVPGPELPIPGPMARTVDPEAYEAYLRARSAARSSPFVGNTVIREYLNESLRLSPENPDALVALGWSYIVEDPAVASALASQALELDPRRGEAEAILAVVDYEKRWNFEAARRRFDRATALEPNSAIAHDWYGVFLAQTGRFDDGFREMKLAATLDPFSLEIHTDMALASYLARRYDDAARQLTDVLRTDPAFVLAHRHLLHVYAARGQIAEYLEELPKAGAWFKSSPGDIDALTVRLRRAYLAEGERGFWRAQLDFESQRQSKAHVLGLARVYAHLGDRERCIAVLEEGYRRRDDMLAPWIKTDPELDSVRSDPRFQSLLKRIGYP
jgi:TolB-like protein/DNA-binding winged helix-turn-helix (wHTH) protein/Tfp pilus assembly protein PilF